MDTFPNREISAKPARAVQTRRVVVTGMAAISALGKNRAEALSRLHELRNAVRYVPEWEKYKGLRTKLCAPIPDYAPPKFDRKALRTMSSVSVIATDATQQALADAGLADSAELRGGRAGVAYGSCSGSLSAFSAMRTLFEENSTRDFDATTYVRLMGHTVPVNIALFFKTTGRLIPTSTACTSGSLAIGSSYEAIKFGFQDIMLAGGAETLNLPQVCIFDALFATSTKNDSPATTPAPFDAARDGLVVGEGAGTLILEEMEHALRRGAKIYAEIIGFGTNTDGTHITNPNAATMAKAMQLALDDAGIAAGDVGYVNAHGTATETGDVAESRATEQIFGDGVPVSTLKSYIGHTLGACGAIEAIATIDMMNAGWFAPNLNLKNVDPACGKLDYITGAGREMETGVVMSNNFAFGGINTSLIFKKWNGA